ncbi:MAG: pyrroloquinoline quinone-dependent dehydrogenase [Bryobacteraceae bacterium]
MRLGNTILFLVLAQFSPGQDWPNYGNDKGGTRYSPLDQITSSNVQSLQNVWTFHTGDVSPVTYRAMECNPIVVNGVMYLTSSLLKLFALQADTGQLIWKYDALSGTPPQRGTTNRGVAYWTDGTNKRILFGTSDARLISLDAVTGKPDAAFGLNGVVDLKRGVGRDITGLAYGVTSSPVVFEDTVILGFLNTESPGLAAPGDVRAFNVRTGAQMWSFQTVPGPGQFGNDTWAGTSWQNRGGANNWSGASVDVKNALVFVATGSAPFDFYGGDRVGDNLFANSVIALNARTGERVWHYQLVHHDLWDYDLPTYPMPITVNQSGTPRDLVVQLTKTGYVYVFDRLTGKPIFKIVEMAAPTGGVSGEQVSATQPVPVKPPTFTKQGFFATDVTNISPEANAYVLNQIANYQYGPMFTPPSMKGTIQMPGILGGSTWSGASFDPDTNILYVNSNQVPWVVRIAQAPAGSGYPWVLANWHRLLDPNGYPGVKPPWGTMSAIDLGTAEIKWQIPLGEYPELTAQGIPVTGTENIGGNIVTAGGVIFTASTRDEKFRAFDKTTGQKLWEFSLPAAGYALPSTYTVNGRQYVVIAAGGGGKLGTKTSDAYFAFALPPAAQAGEQ